VTAPRLAAPGSEPGFIGSLAVPAELWWAAREPAPLAGMAYPHRADWDLLLAAGFSNVVCLTDGTARYDSTPLVSHAVLLQDQYVAGPTDPDGEHRRVAEAVGLVVDALSAGEGVLVHCHAGRGRTGTVIGGALVRLGHDPEEVVAWLHRVQRARSKRGWPENPWQADAVRALGAPRPGEAR
jgi:protein-tyrosine phosphatase